MPSDASIYNLANQPAVALQNPLDIQAKRIAIANALASGQMTQLDLQQRRQDMAADAEFRARKNGQGTPTASPAAPAMPASSVPLPFSVDGGVVADPTAGNVPAAPAPAPASAPQTATHDIPDDQILGIYGAKGYGLIHARNEANKLAADAQESQQKIVDSQTNYWGSLAYGLKQVGFEPGAVQGALSQARANGLGSTPAFQQFARAASNPQALSQLADQAIAASPDQQRLLSERVTSSSKEADAKTAADRLTAELPKMQADGQLAALTAQGKAPIQPAEQARINQEAKNIAERARHDRVEENNAALNRESVTLTPDAKDQMATYFATTGQLPNLGMGAAVAKTRSDIINRAAELFPHVAYASNAANFQANKSSLKNVQGTLDTLSAFENAGLKNLKMFTDAAAKIPDTGVPWLNVPVRMLDEKLVGSTNMSVVNAAREIGLREIARVTNDPKLSGVLSDSARHEVQGFSPANATLPQILAVSKVLQTDMANVHSSLSEQRDAINSRIAANPNGTGATPAPADSKTSNYKVGDSVMYNGAAHKVTAVKPDGKLVLEGN